MMTTHSMAIYARLPVASVRGEEQLLRNARRMGDLERGRSRGRLAGPEPVRQMRGKRLMVGVAGTTAVALN
jgi:hypothetical protein